MPKKEEICNVAIFRTILSIQSTHFTLTHSISPSLPLSFSAMDACNAYKVRSIYFHFWQSKNFSFYQTPNCKRRSEWVSVWVYVKMCECVCVCWLRAAAYPLTTPPLRSNTAFVAVDWPNHLHTECTFCLRFTRRCLPPTVPTVRAHCAQWVQAKIVCQHILRSENLVTIFRHGFMTPHRARVRCDRIWHNLLANFKHNLNLLNENARGGNWRGAWAGPGGWKYETQLGPSKFCINLRAAWCIFN